MNSPNPTPDTPKKTPRTANAAKKDAIELLKADHREVEHLFKQFKSAKGPQRKKLIETIAAALTAHTIIEEEIFYPACREKDVESDELDEAQVEHDTVKLLVADLLKSKQKDDYYDAKVTVLSEYVKHHVGEEEDPSDGIFARAESAGLDMDELGEKLQARKDELMSDEKRLIRRPPEIHSLDLSHLTDAHADMPRYPTDHYRDDRRNGDYRSSGPEYRSGEHRGAYGQYDYDRSDRDHSDDNRPGYLGGTGNSERGYSENTRGAYGYDTARPGQHRLEQSGSGGRYRLDYGQDGTDHRPGAGRNTGGGEGREYFQGTRYGSTYGGGPYRTENDDTEGYDGPGRDDRYYGGQGHRAYGDSSEWEERRRRHDLGGRGPGGGNHRPGSGFRGNR